MNSSSMDFNAASISERSREIRRRRRKKIKSSHLTGDQIRNQTPSGAENHNNNQFWWKSENTEQMYSSKLLESLQNLRASSSSSSTSAKIRGRSVRQAADRALAMAARGKTRWSRAILINRLKFKLTRKRRRRGAMASAPSGRQSAARKPSPVVQRKVRALGRLVPGCRKEALPVILEEATDYIGALEMQIRAMTTLTELLARFSSAGGGESTPSAVATADHSPAN